MLYNLLVLTSSFTCCCTFGF